MIWKAILFAVAGGVPFALLLAVLLSLKGGEGGEYGSNQWVRNSKTSEH